MTQTRAFTHVLDQLKAVGLRPTRQRLALAKLLFEGGDRHVTAESLHGEAENNRMRVSLATVYNTLHQFTAAGLLREVVVAPGRSYFDTNRHDHHHFYHETTGELTDIPGDEVALSSLPTIPSGRRISRVDVVIRLSDEESAADASPLADPGIEEPPVAR